jgi:paraquat-inducible protein A
MLVLWRLDNDLHSKALRSLGRLLCRIKPWLMVDVFLIGVLISLVKLMGMADIKMGLSFWAFVGYTLLLIKMISSLDRMWLWQRCSARRRRGWIRGQRPGVRAGGLPHLRRPERAGCP